MDGGNGQPTVQRFESSRKPAAIYYRCLPCGVEDLEKVLRQV